MADVLVRYRPAGRIWERRDDLPANKAIRARMRLARCGMCKTFCGDKKRCPRYRLVSAEEARRLTGGAT